MCPDIDTLTFFLLSHGWNFVKYMYNVQETNYLTSDPEVPFLFLFFFYIRKKYIRNKCCSRPSFPTVQKKKTGHLVPLTLDNPVQFIQARNQITLP